MPNDPNVIKEWQKVNLNDVIKVKPADVVCSLHFNSSSSSCLWRLHFNSKDIIREKTFTGPDGSVVARVSIGNKIV